MALEFGGELSNTTPYLPEAGTAVAWLAKNGNVMAVGGGVVAVYKTEQGGFTAAVGANNQPVSTCKNLPV